METKASHITMRITTDAPTSDPVLNRRRLWRNRILAILATFSIILIVRWEVVASPPYFDAAIGIWREAEYLARTNFDFYSLRYESDTGLGKIGGPRSYMTSVIPGALAVLYRAFPGTHVPIVIYHLVVFLAAAAAAVLLYEILERRVGRGLALVASLAATTTPIYCTQIDMVAFETFLSFVSVLWLKYIDEDRFWAANGVSFAAFLIKPTGMILSTMLFAYLIGRTLVEGIDRRLMPTRWIFVTTITGLVLWAERRIVIWGGTLGIQLEDRVSMAMALAWFPDVLLLAGIAGLFCVGLVLLWIVRFARSSNRVEDVFREVWRSIVWLVRKQAAFLCALGFVVALGIAISSVRFVPRYAALAVPFLYYIATITAHACVRRTSMLAFAMVAVVAVNIVNWNGILFPPMGWSLEELSGIHRKILAREGSLYERSHEYLANHLENLHVTKIALDAAQGVPIVTSTPFNTYLRYPELGVVDEPVPVYSVFPTGGAISKMGQVRDLRQDRPEEVICLVDASTWFTALAVAEIPAPRRGDRLLYGRRNSDGLVVYRKRFGKASDVSWRSWVAVGASRPAMTASRLWSAYRNDSAASVFTIAEVAAAHEPLEGIMNAILAASSARIGAWDRTLAAVMKAEARLGAVSSPQSLERSAAEVDELGMALEALADGETDLALQHAMLAVMCDAPPVAAFIVTYRSALAQLDAGDIEGAKELFRAILRSSSDFWPARIGLAKAEWRLGNLDKASSYLSQVLAVEPSAEEAVRMQAILALEEGDVTKAESMLEDYMQRFPTAERVQNCLFALRANHDATESTVRSGLSE